jgi:hypothetical protein
MAGGQELLALPASSGSGESTAAMGSSNKAKKTKHEFYDQIYFDSDDEDNYEGMGDAKVINFSI